MTRVIEHTSTGVSIIEIGKDFRPLVISNEALPWFIGELAFFVGYHCLVYARYIHHPMTLDGQPYYTDVGGHDLNPLLLVRAGEVTSLINLYEAREIIVELDPKGLYSRTTHVLHIENGADGFDLKCILTAPTGEAFDYHLPIPSTHVDFFINSLSEYIKRSLTRVRDFRSFRLNGNIDELELYLKANARLPTLFARLERPDEKDYRMSFTLEMVREVLHALAPEKVPPEAWQEDLSKVLIAPVNDF